MANGHGASVAAGKPGWEQAAAIETAPAAVLAFHAAVGLAWPLNRQAARMLRAAEAMCRSSVAFLGAPQVQFPQPQEPNLSWQCQGCGTETVMIAGAPPSLSART